MTEWTYDEPGGVMSHAQHWGHLGHTAHSIFHKLPPLESRKSPVLAFVLAFFFGVFGMLYLGWQDALVWLALIVLGVLAGLLTAGLTIPLCWVLGGVWATMRVVESNKYHDGPTGAATH